MSIAANIAEGFKRRGIKDKIHFYDTSEGSLEELGYFIILSQDLQYIPTSEGLMSQSETVGRLLNGLITSTERRLLSTY